MSHDVFEDELRGLLHDAVDTEADAFAPLDPASVVDSGRRVVRRRRVVALGGTLAAVLVVGVGTWAAVSDSTDRAVQEVPATRTTMADVGVVEVTLERPAMSTDAGQPSWTVSLDTATGEVRAVGAGDEAPLTPTFATVPRNGTRAVWVTVSQDPFTVVGVLPAAASQLMTRYVGDVGGPSENTGPLPGTPYQAMVLGSEKSPEGAELAGLDWATDDAVFDADGREVPSVAIGDRRVYVDEPGDELGVVEPDGSARTALSASTDRGLPASISTGRQDPGQQMTTTFVMVLPTGSDSVSADLADGVRSDPTETATLPGGRGTVALVRATGPQVAGPVVTGLTWARAGRWWSWRDGGSLVVPLGAGENAVQLSVDVLSGPTGTQVVVGSPEGGSIGAAGSLRAESVGADGVGRAGEGVGSDRFLALVPEEPVDVVPSGTPSAAFSDGAWEWSSTPVAGTTDHLVAVVARPDVEVTGWTGLRWTSADGTVHDVDVE